MNSSDSRRLKRNREEIRDRISCGEIKDLNARISAGFAGRFGRCRTELPEGNPWRCRTRASGEEATRTTTRAGPPGSGSEGARASDDIDPIIQLRSNGDGRRRWTVRAERTGPRLELGRKQRKRAAQEQAARERKRVLARRQTEIC